MQNITELFVPGRVCLFGEHSDWAGAYRNENPAITPGSTIITGTNCGIHARVRPHSDKLLLHSVIDGKHVSAEFSMEPDELLATAQAGGHWAYIAGVAWQIQQRFPIGGLEIDNYLTDLPVKKGLSSSAAISVLTARAFSTVYGLEFGLRDEMEYAYLGEITTPSQCGRMDQGCAFGQVPIRMRFDGDNLDVEPLIVGGEIHMVIVDLRAGKDTQRILADLNRCYPEARNNVDLGVHHLLGELNLEITDRAVNLLAAGDATGLGVLMTAAQAHFDHYAKPACPTELASPVLHSLLADERIQDYSWGGKGVGSQGDGSAQFVARGAAEQKAIADYVEKHLGMHAVELTIRPSHASNRAHELDESMLTQA